MALAESPLWALVMTAGLFFLFVALAVAFAVSLIVHPPRDAKHDLEEHIRGA